MLINHSDAERVGRARIINFLLLIIDPYRAFVRDVIAHNAFGERTFPGAILAQQRVKTAGRKFKRNIIEGSKGTEALRHARGFEVRRYQIRQCIASKKASELLTVPK